MKVPSIDLYDLPPIGATDDPFSACKRSKFTTSGKASHHLCDSRFILKNSAFVYVTVGCTDSGDVWLHSVLTTDYKQGNWEHVFLKVVR